jgi:hypothetical protein
LTKVAPQFPQTAYAGIQQSLQQEWQFVQRVIDGIGVKFSGVEAALKEVFIPALFGETTPVGIHLREITALPVKVLGLSIPNAKHSATKIVLTRDCCSTGDLESFGSRSDAQASSRGSSTELDKGRRDYLG